MFPQVIICMMLTLLLIFLTAQSTCKALEIHKKESRKFRESAAISARNSRVGESGRSSINDNDDSKIHEELLTKDNKNSTLDNQISFDNDPVRVQRPTLMRI